MIENISGSVFLNYRRFTKKQLIIYLEGKIIALEFLETELRAYKRDNRSLRTQISKQRKKVNKG